MQVAGNDAQRKVRQLTREFNHRCARIQHDGISRLNKAGRHTGNCMFLRQTPLHFFVRRGLGRNKPVKGNAAVGAANDALLVELNQVAADGRR